MKIKVCDPFPDGACCFYRSLGPLSKLSKLDSTISIELLKNVSWYTISDADILFFERPQDQHYLEAMQMGKDYNIPIWVDFDDDLFSLPRDNPGYSFYSKKNNQAIIEKCIKLADIVTVATETIKQQFSHLNKNIVVIENSLNDYNIPLEKIKNRFKIISWRGSNTHRNDLLSCSEGMFNLAKKYEKEWSWVFVGGQQNNDLWYITDYIKQHFNLKECDIVTYHKFLKDLKSSIHMVPLVVNQFNKSKSNISWIEGTLAGAAVIAPQGLSEFDRPGITTYNPENPDSFGYFLEKLMKDEKLRLKNYQKSFDFIEENLLLSKVNKKRLKVIEELMQKKNTNNKEGSLMKFEESKLAHKYCKGDGIELGPSAHNSFGLDSIKIAPKERIEFWNKSQELMGEKPVEIDIYGDAENIPLDSKSMNYILNSHVIEHVPNPIKAFIEWDRILKEDGIMFMIFPKRDADPIDAKKPISELESFINQFKNPKPLTDEHCHIWIFTLQRMLELIDYCNENNLISWEIIETQETDDKVGNGHTIVCKKK